jgi:hypothetical protein
MLAHTDGVRGDSVPRSASAPSVHPSSALRRCAKKKPDSCGRVARPGRGRPCSASIKQKGCRPVDIRDRLERKLPRMSAILLFVGSAGWCWPVLGELRSLILVSPAAASIHRHVSLLPAFNRCRGKADSEIGKLDPFDSSIYAPSAPPHLTPRLGTRLGHESRARIVARERSRLQTRFLERGHARLKHAAKELKPSLKPPVRLASLEGAAPPVEATPSHIPSNAGALTSLVDFETAPFPYHGTMPDSGRPFLNAGLRAIGATSISAQCSLGVSDFQ